MMMMMMIVTDLPGEGGLLVEGLEGGAAVKLGGNLALLELPVRQQPRPPPTLDRVIVVPHRLRAFHRIGGQLCSFHDIYSRSTVVFFFPPDPI
jgi:hypothetical protein